MESDLHITLMLVTWMVYMFAAFVMIMIIIGFSRLLYCFIRDVCRTYCARSRHWQYRANDDVVSQKHQQHCHAMRQDYPDTVRFEVLWIQYVVKQGYSVKYSLACWHNISRHQKFEEYFVDMTDDQIGNLLPEIDRWIRSYPSFFAEHGRAEEIKKILRYERDQAWLARVSVSYI